MNNINLIKEYQRNLQKEDFEKAIVVIDNNCLLFPFKDYNLSDNFLSGLEEIKHALYIPFVTQVEYLDNFANIVNATKGNLEKSRKLISDIKNIDFVIENKDITDIVHRRLFSKIDQLKNEDDMKSFYEKSQGIKENYYRKANDSIKKISNELNDILMKSLNELDWGKFEIPQFDDNQVIEEKIAKFHSILDDIEKGEAYTSNQVAEFEEQIEKRYENKVSPGYEDLSDKENKLIYFGNNVINRSYSDAIFWIDSLRYANSVEKNEKRYLIILSNEKKKDWVTDKDSSKINLDMFFECYQETGLIAKKIDVWEFMSLLNVADEQDIEQSKETFEDEEYSFMLYGQRYNSSVQADMMEKIFRLIVPRINAMPYSIPCMIDTTKEDWKRSLNTTFTSSFDVQDKMGVLYRVGTSMNLPQKLSNIFKLLESRVQRSSSQLKFIDEELQKQWEEVCQRKTRK